MTGSSSFNTKVIMWFKLVDLPSIPSGNKLVIVVFLRIFYYVDTIEIFKNCLFILKNNVNSSVVQQMTLSYFNLSTYLMTRIIENAGEFLKRKWSCISNFLLVYC